MDRNDPQVAQIAEALRLAIRCRRTWPMPAVLLRFTDGDAPAPEGNGPYGAAPEAELKLRDWPGRGRAYEIIAELDDDELQELAGYSEEDLLQYVSEILVW